MTALPVLLVVDVDDTLAQAPRFSGELTAWEQSLVDDPPPAIAGAHLAVPRLVASADAVLVLTGRSERVRAATHRWLDEHFPSLTDAPVSMRAIDDERPSYWSKAERLEQFIGGGSYQIVMVDDDTDMREACTARDVFLLAPGCWWLAGKVAP